MRKNLIYSFLAILFILLILSFNCSEKGVEWSLIGTWNLTDFEYDYDYYIEDPEGTLIIYSNDTYDMDLIYIIKSNGLKYKSQDTGTLKACSINKYIQFFSDKYDDMNYRYTLNCNLLILESDKYGVKYTYQKNY